MEAIKANSQQTLEIKHATDSIAETLSNVLAELKNVRDRCTFLEKENVALGNEIHFLKRQLRANNFILHKVQETPDNNNENLLETVQNICKAANINLPESAINKCFRLGKGEKNRPILVSLTNNILKQEIMKKKDLFYQNNTPISHDRSPEDREYGRRVYNCLSLLRKIDKNATYYKNKFKLRGAYHTLEEAEDIIQDLLEENDTSSGKKLKPGTMDKLSDFRFRGRTDSK